MSDKNTMLFPTSPLPMRLWSCLGTNRELCSLHWTRQNAVAWRAIAGHPWRQSYRIVRVEVREVPKKGGTR